MSHRPSTGQAAPGWVGAYFLIFIFSVMVARLWRTGDPADGVAVYVLPVLALVAYAIALPRCRGLTFWISIVILILGVTLAAREGQWVTWLSGTTALAPVLAVITFTQLLAEPIEIGNYHRDLIRFLESKARWRNARLHVALFSAFMFTCMAAGGALAATYRVLVRPEDDESIRKEVLRFAMRGAGAAIGLTPITGVFAVTVAVTGLSVPVLFLLASPAAVVTLVLALLACSLTKLKETPPDLMPVDLWRLVHLGMALTCLMICIALFGTFLDIASIDAIIFGIVVVAIGWGFLLERRRFVIRLMAFPKRIVGSTAPSVALFVPAGALAVTVSASDWAGNLLGHLLLVFPPAFVTYAVGGSIWLLFHLGIHPAVAVAVVGPVALSGGLVSPTMMAFLALAACGTAVISSPFGGLANLAASISGRSVFEVGLRPHLLFSLASLIVSIMVVNLLFISSP